MLYLDEAQTRAALAYRPLIDALAAMFGGDCVMPVRHHHGVEVPGEPEATLLLMPAWVPGSYMGLKMVSVFPGNGARGLPAVAGTYLLSDGRTGALLAILDGGELTARRTAAASALAGRYLVRAGARKMVMVGAGRLAAHLVAAHAGEHALTDVAIWARDPIKAEETARSISLHGVTVTVATDLEAAVRDADIISAATLSTTPLIRGGWLKPGAHVDLVGAFKRDMRETDDAAVAASTVFVDTRDGVLGEGGDILQAIASGAIDRTAIAAELADLVTKRHGGRRDDQEITLFKSVGAALEDLAAAILAYETVKG
ncbi:ornithine cyclodeaminase [Rhizobium sp. RU20A]|uniref:ornithine cyclodeaminase family protein n=1 Tax=Rhizobium sp. RU20A TaxID=1907412 RepID=UPI0009569773|nr:ornithine cyclodeaminase family protein [Rhizobium sp. RU20A]SIQ82243.1 ornithine cyclodeaminase [Rhizobium sp. RU20A]